jgi:hypothetical protein
MQYVEFSLKIILNDIITKGFSIHTLLYSLYQVGEINVEGSGM